MAGKPTERIKAEHKFAKAIEILSKDRAVTIGGGKGFGNGALKSEGKIFAMITSTNQFVVKHSKDRVNALVAPGTGQRFEPRPGRPMNEWLVVTGENIEWLPLAKRPASSSLVAIDNPQKDVRSHLRRPSMEWKYKKDSEESQMSDFTFLYRGRDTTASPEQMQKTMEKWRAWFKELGEKGHLKDIGHPLERTGKVVKGKQKSVTDGPFAEAKDVVGGFSLIQARDLNQAVELSKDCPILDVGGSVEVRQIQVINM